MAPNRRPALGWGSRAQVVAAAFALASGASGASGCKKASESANPAGSEPAAPGAAPTAEAPAEAEPHEPARAEAEAAEAALPRSGFAVFPDDTEFVFSVSVSRARSSGLWKRYHKAFTRGLYADADFKQLIGACGFDPLDKIDSFLVGGNTSAEKGVLVIKGLTRAEVKTCADKVAAAEGGTVTVDGDLIGAQDGSTTVWAGWLDDTTLVASTDVADKAYLQQRLRGERGIDRDASFMQLIGNVGGEAAAWFAMIPRDGSPVAMGMAAAPSGAPAALYGSVGLDGGVQLDVGIRFETAAEAAQTAAMARSMLPAFKREAGEFGRYLESVKLDQSGRDLRVRVGLSDSDVDAVLKSVADKLGGLEAVLGHEHP